MVQNQGPWGAPPGSGGGHKPGGNNPQGPDMDEMIKKAQAMFDKMGNGNSSGPNKKIITLVVMIVCALWASSGVYKVEENEQGVVLRFGEFHRTEMAGLHIHWPYPIERVFIPQVTDIKTENIGFREQGGGQRIVPSESIMLTKDKNLASVPFVVQWKIANAEKYLFNVRDPEDTVRPVAETAMREVIGNSTLNYALSEGKEIIALRTKELMQQIFDSYEVGIEVTKVNLKAVDAPAAVVEAFNDVIAAQQEREKKINDAVKYQDSIIPVAQGNAEKKIKDAEAYREAVINQAEGEANRFIAVYEEYKLAKDVTKKRMYLETMEEILRGMDKIILDDKAAGSAVPYLPLPELKKRTNG